MTAVLNLLIPILAGVAALAGIYFLIRAFSNRTAETRASYNVARQHAHRDKQVQLIRAVFLFLLALILLGVFGLNPQPIVPTPTVIPTLEPTTAVPPTSTTQPIVNFPTVQPSTTPAILIVPTSEPSPTIERPTAVPTSTPTAAPRTASVSSGVGVWLRSEPNTTSEQLEWLLEGAVVTVLPETATGENLAWQQVQTAEGVVGWVAVPFITFNDQ